MKPEFTKAVEDFSNAIFDKLSISASQQFNVGSGAPVKGRLTVRSGALIRALMGTGSRARSGQASTGNSVREMSFTPDSLTLKWGVQGLGGPAEGRERQYSLAGQMRMHEYGGTRVITEPMRRFFWKQYYLSEKSNPMWKRLALSQVHTYPARPVMAPAIASVQPMIEQEASILFNRVMTLTYEIIQKKYGSKT